MFALVGLQKQSSARTQGSTAAPPGPAQSLVGLRGGAPSCPRGGHCVFCHHGRRKPGPYPSGSQSDEL